MRKNLSFLIFVLFFLLVATVSFNVIVDPYNVFGLDLVPRNIILDTTNRRIVIPGIIRRYKPECIIAGTSRVGRGLNPLSPILKGKKCVNLFINAGDAHEVATLIKFSVAHSKNLKLLFVGLDYFMFDFDLDGAEQMATFNEQNYSIDNPLINLFKDQSFTLSLDIFKKSVEKILSKKEPILTFQKLQENSFHDGNGPRTGSYIDIVRGYVRQTLSLVTKGRGHNYYQFELAQKKINEMKDALMFAAKAGVEVKVFINPEHVYFFMGLELANQLDNFYSLIRSFAELTSNSMIEFYNFNYPTKETTEINDSKYSSHFPDAGHYDYVLGDRILERVLGLNYSQADKNIWGKKITASSAEQDLNEIKSAYDAWRRNERFHYDLMNKVFLNCNNASGSEKKKCAEQIVLDFFSGVDKNLFGSLGYSDSQFSEIDSLSLNESETKVFKSILKDIKWTNDLDNMVLVPAQKIYSKANPFFREASINLEKQFVTNGFYIDKYEATIRDWVAAQMEIPVELKDKISSNGNLDMPITNITWNQALEFCKKNGKRLPTEDEWMIAAGIDLGRFPWGNKWPDCNDAYFNSDEGSGCGTQLMLAVDRSSKKLLQGKYGIHNIVGNVAEWTIGLAAGLNSSDLAQADQIRRVIKGGDFESDEQYLVIRHRYLAEGTTKGSATGVRCVLPLEN